MTVTDEQASVSLIPTASTTSCEMCTDETSAASTTVVVQHPHGGSVQLAACDWCVLSIRRLAALTGGHASFAATVGLPPSGLPGVPRGPRAVTEPELVLELLEHVQDTARTHYVVRIYGRERVDGVWEGWLVFVAVGAPVALRTGIETTQRSLADLAYWAGGLKSTYLKGAFKRAQRVLGT
jgi:hypothetical protein